jgi:hypothetical protein
MKKAKSLTKLKSERVQVNEGDKLTCDECGLTIVVEECGDDDCGVECCAAPMRVCVEDEQEA